MALGWALKRMSEDQYRKILDQMNDGAGGNFAILNAIRAELTPDEDLLTFIEGEDGNKRKNCLLALTDRRLFVAQKSGREESELEAIPFGEILFGGYRHTLIYGRLDVWQGQVERHFNSKNKDLMDAFGQAFTTQFDKWYEMSSRREVLEGGDANVEQTSREDPFQVDELERLADL